MLGEMFQELDESGARGDRPLFRKATRRVGGETSGVVVAKLDRWARSLPHALAAIEEIQAAGGFIVSVQDGLDSRTESGKLVLRILFSVAEWELDRIRESYASARRMAIARGAYTARAPIGYRKRADGVLEIDPAVGSLITEAFRRRANRASLRDLGRFLEETGGVTSNGYANWDSKTLRMMFLTPAYIGTAHSGEYIKPHAHPALTDTITFHRVQRPP